MLIRNNKKILHQIILIFVELLVIAAGILLGLAADDWKTNLNNQKRADNTLFYLQEELHYNLNELLTTQKKQMESLKGLDSLLALTETMFKEKYKDNKTFYLKFLTDIGIHIPLIKTNSWQYANKTGNLSLLEAQLVIKLTDLYTIIDFYNDVVKDIIENVTVANNMDHNNRDGLLLSQSVNYGSIIDLGNKITVLITNLLSELEGEQQPWFNDPFSIPGKIEVEYFDKGGLGIAYSYSDLDYDKKFDSVIRKNEYVQIYQGKNGNYFVAWVHDGEWLEYTVDVKDSMYFDISVNYATKSSGNGFLLEIDDVIIIEPNSLPVTDGWEEWVNINIGRVYLKKGKQILRLKYKNAGLNLDYIEFKKSDDQNY